MVYLLTFGCYGSHLPGDERGSVERTRPGRGGYLEPSAALTRFARSMMKNVPYRLKPDRAPVVLGAIREVCAYGGWGLLAAHVRTTHVHVVVDLATSPDLAIGDFKAYASRSVNKVEGPRIRWARAGSTIRLVAGKAVQNAIRYVVSKQGEPMAVFVVERGFEKQSPA